MEGTRIELQERSRIGRQRRGRQSPIGRYFKGSGFYHSYTFRFDKPYKRSTKDTPALKTTRLELPADFIAFNTGASLERWSKKRARLKSSRKDPSIPENEDPCDEPPEPEEPPEETLVEVHEEDCCCPNKTEPEQPEEKELVDPDILKLIRKSAKFEEKKGKQKKRSKMRKKTITFSISKPQSPETGQVIRVDVTSNYSYEEYVDREGSNDGENYYERFQEILDEIEDYPKGSSDSSSTVEPEFTVLCKKLTLSSRD